MDVRVATVKSILTKQTGGFLTSGPYPYTHTLSAYTGCAFGATTCGMYCYAQHLPNWAWSGHGLAWGSAVVVKENAVRVLEATMRAMRPEKRRCLRIFMSSSTDPYQPLEAEWRLTRRCLEVFARYPDLDLLVIQTRAALAERDFDLLQAIPYAWLSVTIETDDPEVFKRLRGGPRPGARFALVRVAVRQEIKTQITVSPCLPHSDSFALALADAGARRVVVDTFEAGDGSGGARTGQSPYAAAVPDRKWRDANPAKVLYDRLSTAGVAVGWSAAGFCGIPPREPSLLQSAVHCGAVDAST